MYKQQKDFKIKISQTLVSTAVGYDIITEVRCLTHPYTDLILVERKENISALEMSLYYTKSDGWMDYTEIIEVTHKRVQRIFAQLLKK